MATVCNRETHPDYKLFELTDQWSEIIYLEDGETPEDLGWIPTGKFGNPGRGHAMLTEAGRTIYVHDSAVGRDEDTHGGIATERHYEILHPVAWQNQPHDPENVR